MLHKLYKKTIQMHDRGWLWVQRIIKKLVRLDSAPSRWGFATSLLAFSLFSITLAPAIRALGSEKMISFSWICLGTGIAFFIILLSFISFISRNAPRDEGIAKLSADITKLEATLGGKLDRLIELMEKKNNDTKK